MRQEHAATKATDNEDGLGDEVVVEVAQDADDMHKGRSICYVSFSN